MLAALYTTAVDLPLCESAWWLAALWFVRTLCLWSFFWGGCPCCGTCSHCSGSTPDQLEVTTSGFSDQGCSTCDEQYSGVFVLDRATNVGADGCAGTGDLWDDGTVEAECQWTYVVSSPCTTLGGLTLNRFTVTIRDQLTDGNSWVAVRWWRTGDVFCGPFGQYLRNPSTSPSQTGIVDCAAFSSYEVAVDPAHAADTMRGGGVCNSDGSSAFITAL